MDIGGSAEAAGEQAEINRAKIKRIRVAFLSISVLLVGEWCLVDAIIS
jgi:hypothetical protein